MLRETPSDPCYLGSVVEGSDVLNVLLVKATSDKEVPCSHSDVQERINRVDPMKGSLVVGCTVSYLSSIHALYSGE